MTFRWLKWKTKQQYTFKLKLYKKIKLPVHWSLKIPKRYKRTAIFSDLHLAKSKSTYFDAEARYVINRFQKADYPLRFGHST